MVSVAAFPPRLQSEDGADPRRVELAGVATSQLLNLATGHLWRAVRNVRVASEIGRLLKW